MKILVYGTNWIGDAVMTIPALKELKRIFPESDLTLFTRKWAKGIFVDCDFVDHLVFPRDDSKSALSSISEGRDLQKGKYDIGILFTNSFRTALTAKFAKIPIRFGYRSEGRGFLLSHSVAKPAWKNEKHEAFYYLNLVAEINKELLASETQIESVTDTSIMVSEERRTSASLKLKEFGCDLTKPLIGLGVGSQNSRAKRWPADRFGRLNDLLQEEFDANVVLIGSEQEIDPGELTVQSSNRVPINLIGKTKLDEAVALLSLMDMFVSNDMGLAHVSSAVGTKTLTIFGPTNPETTRPIGGSIIKRDDVECAPCMLRDCPIDHRCMTRIEPEHVFAKVKSLMTREL